MYNRSLYQAVQKFAETTAALSEADLERPWAWGDYKEGVRFSFFRTYEELRTLAAISYGSLTPAQATLAQYHLAYRDLQAVLIGVSDEEAARKMEEGEWPLTWIIPHIIGADRGFYLIINYTIERARSKDERPLAIPEAEAQAFWKSDNFDQVAASGSLKAMMEYYEGWHNRVLEAFSSISNEEMALPSMYWESQPYSIEFRLHRFDAHLRQHTVHAEKVLVKLGNELTEAKRLLRWIYAALAEVEGLALPGGIPEADQDKLAASLEAQRLEIQKVLSL